MNETKLIFLIILCIQVILGENQYEKYQNDSNSIRCLLLKKRQDPCIVLGGKAVPQHLLQVYKNLPERIQNVIKANGMIWNLTSEEYKYIPPNYWLLMPVERLSELSGYNLSSILLAYPKETSIAAQIMSALSSSEQRNSFLVSISMKRNLSEDIEDIIAEEVSTWRLDKDWNYIRVAFVGSPLLAHFPPHYLFTSPHSVITKCLFFIISSDRVNNPEWLKKPKLIQRIWSYLFYENYHLHLTDWKVIHMNRFQYFLPGMIPDQLSDLKKTENIDTLINKRSFFKLNFDMQQVQLLFDTLYHDKTLTSEDFDELSNSLMKLSPLQLQKFPLKATNFRKLEILSNILNENNDFITMKQITQMIIAKLKFQRTLDGIHSSEWGSSLQYLGTCAYTLSLHEIRQSSRTPLDIFALEKIESSKLSFAQIYYLTQNGTSLRADQPTTTRSLKWMLRGLPASEVRRMNLNEISSRIWLALLSNLPGDNMPRSFAFLKHIIHLLYDIDSINVLQSFFINPSMEDYFKIIPSNFLKNITRRISDNFNELRRRYSDKVQKLPRNVLSLLLNENRDKSWIWNSSLNHASSLRFLIRGLTCYDIEKLDLSEFIYVMSQYNKELREVGQVFPKNLQHCCYEKLIKYLKIKSQIMQEDLKEGLISLLEPGDIEAVGGYVLTAFPTSAIAASKYSKQILTKIGKLSVPELLLAVSKQKMYDLIELALAVFRRGDELGHTEFFQMGNLVLFLPADALIHIKPSTLKLIVQLNYTDRRLCTDKKTRLLWSDVVIKAFGDVELWTEGVIASLDDFLLVIGDEILHKINKSTWLKVAEPLNFHYGDNIEWWKDDIPFHEACLDVLDVSEHIHYSNEIEKLVRWQLKLAQWKLNTVKTAGDFLLSQGKLGSRNKKVPTDFVDKFLRNNSTKLPGLILIDSDNTKICFGNCSSNQKINKTDKLITHDLPNVTDDNTSYFVTTPSEKVIEVISVTSTENGITSTKSSSIFGDSNESSDAIPSTTEQYYESTDTTEPLSTKKVDVSSQSKPNSQSNLFTGLLHMFFNPIPPDIAGSTKSSIVMTTVKSASDSETPSEEYRETTSHDLFVTKSKGSTYPGDSHLSDVHSSTTALSDVSDHYHGTNPHTDFSNSFDSVTDRDITTEFTAHETSQVSNFDVFEKTTNYNSVKTDYTNSYYSELHNNENSEKIENTSEATTPLITTTVVSEMNKNYSSSTSDSEGTESNVLNASDPTVSEIDDIYSENYDEKYMFTSTTSQNQMTSEIINAVIETSNSSPSSHNITFSSTTISEDSYDLSFYNCTDVSQITLAANLTTESSINKELTDLSTPGNSSDVDEKLFDPEDDYDTVVNSNENNMADEPISRLILNIAPIKSEVYDNYNLFEYAPDYDYNYVNNNNNIYGKIITKRDVHAHYKSENDNITCDALRVVGHNLQLILNETHIKMMSDDEIKDCIEVFGGMDLPHDVKMIIWKKITDKDLHLMGSLVKAVSVSDISKMNFSFDEPWLLEKLHLLSKFTPGQDVVKKTIEKVIEANNIKQIDPESLASLNHLICKMKRDDRKKLLSNINGGSLAISILGKINDCMSECIQDLAEFSMDDKNYGPPNKWDSYDVDSLGIIPSGLKEDEWMELITNGHNAIMGLQPSVIKCLPEKHLMAIPPELFRLIPYKIAMIIYKEKYNILKQNQKYALQRVITMQMNATENLLPVSLKHEVQYSSFSNKLNQSVLFVILTALSICTFI